MIDEVSLLVEAEGARTLDAIELTLGERGLTLGIDLPEARGAMKVAEWIARGMPGAPSMLVDPADHVVAGLTATLRDGRTLVVRPAPRRAVGPDLIALFTGMGDRFGRVEMAWLRVHRIGARRPTMALPAFELDPPLSEAESAMVGRMVG